MTKQTEATKQWRRDNPDRCRAHRRLAKEKLKTESPELFKAKVRARMARHRQKIRDGQGTIRQVLATLLHRTKTVKGCRARDLVVSIDADYLVSLWESQDGKCALSRIPMAVVPKTLRSVSIDRIDSSGHYTVGNIQLVCKWANLAKNQYTNADILSIITELRSFSI